MARKKKVETITESPIPAGLDSIRDSRGLIKGIEYPYDEFGFVRWRDLIKTEHIVLNKTAWAREGKDVTLLSKEEVEQYKSEASEDKLLIKLAGFRDLARLRGYSDLRHNITWRGDTVICSTQIEWIPNFESNFQLVSSCGVAAASIDSVARDYQLFLESIASNRAFVRCVREFLGIYTVGADEINPNDTVEVSSIPNPTKYLEKICNEKGVTFSVLIKYLQANGLPVDEDWKEISDIPDTVAIPAMELIKNGK